MKASGAMSKIAIGYLLLPIAIFVGLWMEWYFAVPLIGLIIYSSYWIYKQDIKTRFPTRRYILIGLGLSILLAGTTPASSFFQHGNWDWLKHRATFLELNQGDRFYIDDSPVEYSEILTEEEMEVYSGDLLHKFYFAYYLVPTTISPNIYVLNFAILLWTVLGVFLIILLLYPLVITFNNKTLPVILIFLTGPPVLGLIFSIGFTFPCKKAISFVTSESCGTQIPWATELTAQYTALSYVPHQFIPAAIAILLLYTLRKTEFINKIFALLLGTVVLWSPFVSLGLFLFLPLILKFEKSCTVIGCYCEGYKWIFQAIRRNTLLLLTPQNILGALLGGVFTLFMVTGTENHIPFFFLWEKLNLAPDYTGWTSLLRWWVAFYSIVLLWIYLSSLHPKTRKSKWYIYSVAIVLILPLFISYGLFNEIVMRTTLPAMFIIGIFAANNLKLDIKRILGYQLYLLLIVGSALVISISTISYAKWVPLWEEKYYLSQAMNHSSIRSFTGQDEWDDEILLQMKEFEFSMLRQYIVTDPPFYYPILFRY